MNPFVSSAWHEAGHALVALRLGRTIETISLSPDGAGVVRQQKPVDDPDDEEIARSLTVVCAGEAAERLAPHPRVVAPERNGGLTTRELLALVDVAEREGTPSDAEHVEHYRARLGDERIERIEALAEELVTREHVLGNLELLADELLLRGHLTGADVAELFSAEPLVRTLHPHQLPPRAYAA
jgi:hypothetical protein